MSTFLLGFFDICHAQDLIEVEVDEFTGDTTLFTKWVKLKGTKRYSYLRFAKVKDEIILNLRYATGRVLSISKGDAVYFKMKGGSLITLPVPEYTLTCEGCGAIGFAGGSAQGFNLVVFTDNDILDKLETGTIEMFRIHSSKGYIDEKIKEVSAFKVKESISQIRKYQGSN